MIWRVIAIVCAAALALAVVPLVRHYRETPPPPPPPVRLALTPPPGAEFGAGDEVLDAAISPDGREMVFVATVNGVAQLWRRGFDTESAEALNGTEGATLPAWKANGRVVSFFAGGTLKQLSRADGVVRDLLDAPNAAGASWLPDGSLLVAAGGKAPVRRLFNGVAKDATVIKPGDRGHAFPEAAGDLGFVYVATQDSGRQVVRLVSGGTERDLTTTSSHAQVVEGRLVLVRDNALVTQVLDATTGSVTGRSTPVAFNVGVSPAGHGFFAASRRLLAWAPAAPRLRQLAWANTRGGTVTPVGEPADFWQVRLSPNDTEAALTILDPLLKTLDVFVLPLTEVGFAPRRLSTALAADSDPVWWMGGDRVVYRSLQGGQPNLVARSVAEGSGEERVIRSDLDETPTDWRGQTILFHAPGPAGDFDIWSVAETGGTPAPLVRSGFSDSGGRWSPDGRLLAYVSDESGQRDVYVERNPGTGDGSRMRVSRAGGTRPAWGADGRSLFFLRNGRLMRADLAGTPDTTPLQFTAPREAVDVAEVRDYSVAHRSDRVIMIIPAGRGGPPSAGVIVNWTSAP